MYFFCSVCLLPVRCRFNKFQSFHPLLLASVLGLQRRLETPPSCPSHGSELPSLIILCGCEASDAYQSRCPHQPERQLCVSLSSDCLGSASDPCHCLNLILRLPNRQQSLCTSRPTLQVDLEQSRDLSLSHFSALVHCISFLLSRLYTYLRGPWIERNNNDYMIHASKDDVAWRFYI